MSVSPVCPRCGEALTVAPGGPAGGGCSVRAGVTPLHHTAVVAHDEIRAVCADARVPAWVPDPMPRDWAVTGLAWGGEPGARALVVACAGPAPLGGSAELVLAAEEPGVGLGCGYAGLPGVDPGDLVSGPSVAAVPAGAAGAHHRRPGRLRGGGRGRLAVAGHLAGVGGLAARRGPGPARPA